MRIGQLRDPVQVQVLTATEDATGAPVPGAWGDVERVWGRIEEQAGTEPDDGAANAGRLVHTVTLRAQVSLTTKHRLLIGSRAFNIVSVGRMDNQSRAVRVRCVEEV